MYYFKSIVFVLVLCKLSLLCMPIVVDASDNKIHVNMKSALMIFPSSDSNHQLFGHKIAEILLDCDYHITYISPMSYTSARYYPPERYVTHQLPTSFVELEEAYETRTSYVTYKKSFFKLLKINVAFGEKMSQYVFNFPTLREIMKTDKKFDLVILDIAYCESLIGLGQHFNASVILITVEGYSRFLNDITGNPSPVAYVPNEYADFTNIGLSFSDRFVNSFQNVYQWYYLNMHHYGKQKSIYDTNFPNAKVPFDEANKYVDLVLFNSNYLLTGVRPTLPNMINIGGIHLMEEGHPLEKNLLKFINDAPVGVVLFSLGDTFRHTTIPEEKLKEIFLLFASLPLSFVCRSYSMLNKVPPNVYVSQIIPQAELLAHPKVVLFITSGELISMFEAMFHNVPIIGIPLMPSHAQYINKAVSDGWGIRIDYENFKALDFLVAISTITFKGSHYKVVVDRKKLYIDQYRNAEYIFKYWIQYLERHVDNYHITSPGHDMNHFVYHSIDVILPCTILLLILTIIFMLFWFCCCSKVFIYVYKEKKKRQRVEPIETPIGSASSDTSVVSERVLLCRELLYYYGLLDPLRGRRDQQARAVSEPAPTSQSNIRETVFGADIYSINEDPVMEAVELPLANPARRVNRPRPCEWWYGQPFSTHPPGYNPTTYSQPQSSRRGASRAAFLESQLPEHGRSHVSYGQMQLPPPGSSGTANRQPQSSRRTYSRALYSQSQFPQPGPSHASYSQPQLPQPGPSHASYSRPQSPPLGSSDPSNSPSQSSRSSYSRASYSQPGSPQHGSSGSAYSLPQLSRRASSSAVYSQPESPQPGGSGITYYQPRWPPPSLSSSQSSTPSRRSSIFEMITLPDLIRTRLQAIQPFRLPAPRHPTEPLQQSPASPQAEEFEQPPPAEQFQQPPQPQRHESGSSVRSRRNSDRRDS